MRVSIPDRPRGALSLRSSSPKERAERMTRIRSLDPEQFSLALAFLAGYRPQVLDAALEAIEPPSRSGYSDTEPYCLRCNAPLGVFLAHGPEYRHYRGVVTATSKPRPYKADHKPVIAWRSATDTAPQ